MNFDIARWVSTGGQWEVGMWRVIFGVRVRLGRVGAGGVVLDLCCGADPELRHEILCAVMWVVAPLPEDISEGRMKAEFPCASSRIKPINKDECYQQLLDLAQRTIREIHAGSKQIVTGDNRAVVPASEIHRAEAPE